MLSGRATESPADTEPFRAIERARDRFDPGAPVLTPPLTSSTDAGTLRRIGMVVYGFEPFRLSEDDERSHGDDERLSLENVRFGLEVTYAIVTDVCGAKGAPAGANTAKARGGPCPRSSRESVRRSTEKIRRSIDGDA
jgi:acetylornithine deacetylase/succinyl-diaminopimelate desuccinylase-like protein